MLDNRGKISSFILLGAFIIFCILILALIVHYKPMSLDFTIHHKVWNISKKVWDIPKKDWRQIKSAKERFCDHVSGWYRTKEKNYWCYISPDKTEMVCGQWLCLAKIV
ncbi:MAG: hypothetical protein ACTSRP_12470 [Candidatus Helarchaeota archaeon]